MSDGSDGCGVGKSESSSPASSATRIRDLRLIAAVVRFRGEFLGAETAELSVVGLKTSVGSIESDGSTDSVARGRLVLRVVAGFGVAAGPATFFGLPRPLFAGAGAGENSSSSSSCCGAWFSSPSESSSTIGALRRVAAARVDFRGDADDIFAAVVWLVGGGLHQCRQPSCCAELLVNITHGPFRARHVLAPRRHVAYSHPQSVLGEIAYECVCAESHSTCSLLVVGM